MAQLMASEAALALYRDFSLMHLQGYLEALKKGEIDGTGPDDPDSGIIDIEEAIRLHEKTIEFRLKEGDKRGAILSSIVGIADVERLIQETGEDGMANFFNRKYGDD